MSDDCRVSKRSNQQVRDTANRVRRSYGVQRTRPVNVVRCLQSGFIAADDGRKSLVYKVVPDRELGDHDGRTDFGPGVVTITVKKSVHDRAFWGDGRARMTLAHELGHAVMHGGQAKFRGAGTTGMTGLSASNAFESAEHQAKVFAAAFLVDDEVAAGLHSPDEIATEFLVSVEAAEICFERISERAERALAVQRVERASGVFREDMADQRQVTRYAEGLCTRCSNPTLIPIGAKYLCDTCDLVSDQFQDGDKGG